MAQSYSGLSREMLAWAKVWFSNVIRKVEAGEWEEPEVIKMYFRDFLSYLKIADLLDYDEINRARTVYDNLDTDARDIIPSRISKYLERSE